MNLFFPTSSISGLSVHYVHFILGQTLDENAIPSRTVPSFIHSSIHPIVILQVVSTHTLSEITTDSPAFLCVREIFMISKKVHFIIRILFHLFIMSHAFKHYLTETIIVGDIRHLAIVDFVHERAGLSRIVDLTGASAFIAPLHESLEKLYHCPSFYSILDHQIFGHWR